MLTAWIKAHVLIDYLHNPSAGAPSWHLVAIEGEPSRPNEQPKQHNRSADSEADTPSFVVLQPHDEDEPKEGSH